MERNENGTITNKTDLFISELEVKQLNFFWADGHIHQTHEGATLVDADRKNFKIVPPDALKMPSPTLSALRLLSKTFSKLLKFILRNTPLSG